MFKVMLLMFAISPAGEQFERMIEQSDVETCIENAARLLQSATPDGTSYVVACSLEPDKSVPAKE